MSSIIQNFSRIILLPLNKGNSQHIFFFSVWYNTCNNNSDFGGGRWSYVQHKPGYLNTRRSIFTVRTDLRWQDSWRISLRLLRPRRFWRRERCRYSYWCPHRQWLWWFLCHRQRQCWITSSRRRRVYRNCKSLSGQKADRRSVILSFCF